MEIDGIPKDLSLCRKKHVVTAVVTDLMHIRMHVQLCSLPWSMSGGPASWRYGYGVTQQSPVRNQFLYISRHQLLYLSQIIGEQYAVSPGN